jgi:uncharacterized protein (TIGR02145 family)
MNKFFLLLICMSPLFSNSQTIMNIYKNDGTILSIPIAEIDSITYTLQPDSSIYLTGSGLFDVDGNYYSTIILGTQEWMAENLRVIHYCVGGIIPNVTTGPEWGTITTGAWSSFENNSQNELIYGKLYNGYAATGACPCGWHLPSNDEWDVLMNYLGGELVAGGKMKTTGTIETGTGLWSSQNNNATNESNFSGIPGGFRDGGLAGMYSSLHFNGYFWTSTPGDNPAFGPSTLYYRSLAGFDGILYKSMLAKRSGASVRCVKD